MLHFFIGTKAQFIKMAPLMLELKRRGIDYSYIDSGQHSDTTASLRRTFNIKNPDIVLQKKGDIKTVTEAIKWLSNIMLNLLKGRSWIKKKIFLNTEGICLIHGDTMTTLIGMILAKTAGLQVAHVEAGLRSYNIFNPFPEEIIRIICMRYCDFLFSPSSEAMKNLDKMHLKGIAYRTDGNTVIDSLRLVASSPSASLGDNNYVLATCHRYETIRSRDNLEMALKVINAISSAIPVIFVAHGPTLHQLDKFHLREKMSQKIKIIPLQEYDKFVSLIINSRGVISDGGSIQEECAYLNKPCFILRKTTERNDGIGTNAVLWNNQNDNITAFLEMAKSSPRTLSFRNIETSPSNQIVDILVAKATA